MQKPVQRVSSKWTKTIVLSRNPALRKLIPETRRMSRSKLYGMLQQHQMVYIKPFHGSQGRGVIRMERIGGPSGRNSAETRSSLARRALYRYQEGVRVRQFPSFEAAYRALEGEMRARPYLIQKGIRLLSHKGRPLDIRVMVQRNPKGEWVATGIAGRVAHPHKVVTNGSQGGTIYPVDVLLRGGAGRKKRSALIASLKAIGVTAARQLSHPYPGLQEIGADIALDQQLRPWILEVNTAPDPCPFTKLADRSMIRRIVSYAHAYGTTYCLNCTKSKAGG